MACNSHAIAIIAVFAFAARRHAASTRERSQHSGSACTFAQDLARQACSAESWRTSLLEEPPRGSAQHPCHRATASQATVSRGNNDAPLSRNKKPPAPIEEPHAHSIARSWQDGAVEEEVSGQKRRRRMRRGCGRVVKAEIADKQGVSKRGAAVNITNPPWTCKLAAAAPTCQRGPLRHFAALLSNVLGAVSGLSAHFSAECWEEALARGPQSH